MPGLPVADGQLLFLQRLIVRWRYFFFGLVACIMALSFNGQWQVGPDSADYRELGHILATKGQYGYRERLADVPTYTDQEDIRYPGLPRYLAMMERTFGEGVLPPLIGMMIASLACLILAYRVLRFCLPQWVAICVVVGVGTNGRFLQYANELLTDVPFLLGLLLTLYGYELFLRARGWLRLSVAVGVLLGGLILAAEMRPTFWILAVALGLTCAAALLMRLLRRGQAVAQPPVWRFAAIAGAMIAAALLFVLLLDPRHSRMLHGGYEAKVVAGLRDYRHKIIGQLPAHTVDMFEDAVPTGFFGIRFGSGIPVIEEITNRQGGQGRWRSIGLGALLSLLVIFAGVRLMRYNPMWGWLVLVSAGALLVLGPVTRYIIMILPLLLAGWGMLFGDMAQALVKKSPARRIPANALLCAALALVLVPNLVRAGDFIRTQHGFTKPFTAEGKWQGFRHVGFLQVYHDGKWAPLFSLAKMLQEKCSTRNKIVGPEASVLTYLSQRWVYQPEIVVPRHGRQSQSVDMALFPNATSREDSPYYEYDHELKLLWRKEFFEPGATIAGPTAGYTLNALKIKPPRQRRGIAPPPGVHIPHLPRPTTPQTRPARVP